MANLIKRNAIEVDGVLDDVQGRFTRLTETPEYKRSIPWSVEQYLRQLPRSLRAPFLFIAATSLDSDEYAPLLAAFGKSELSPENVSTMLFAWFLYRNSGKGSGDDLPDFATEVLGTKGVNEILHRIIKEAPDDSQAYSAAATRLVNQRAWTSEDIRKFRETWATISHERREAIALSTQLGPRNDYRRYRRFDGMIVVNGENPLESLLGRSGFPINSLSRTRWIDLILPAARELLWGAMSDAGQEFSVEYERLGHEPQQTGAMLERLMSGMRMRAKEYRVPQPSVQGLFGRLSVDRYVFKMAEENLWGPDFALISVFEQPGKVSLARYTLFQAKIIDSDSILVTTKQLRDLVRSSWHSSFYVAWGEGYSPRCISAAHLDSFLRARPRAAGRFVKTARIGWTELSTFSDPLPDLLGDRFLCCELGDPMSLLPGENASDLPARLAEHVGVPRFGTITFTVTVSNQPDDSAGRIVVGEADRFIVPEETGG